MKRYNFRTMSWEETSARTPIKKPKRKYEKRPCVRTSWEEEEQLILEEEKKRKFKKSKTKISKSSFKFEKSPQKDMINNTIAELGNKNGLAIVLDGPNIHTTKILIKKGWNKHAILIPNFDDHDYHIIKRKHINTFFKSLGSQVLEMRRNTMGLIYADYMCSFDGNDQCNPSTDIERIFDNKIMMDNSIFGITISQRGRPKEKSVFVSSDIQRCIWEVQQAAYKNGYSALLYKVGGSYRNGGIMWSGIFSIHKI